MQRSMKIADWLLTSLGLALLACSLVLVPSGYLWADDGSGPLSPTCTNAGACDTTGACKTQTPPCLGANICRNPAPPRGNVCTTCTCQQFGQLTCQCAG
jgi:hypothetical protein